MLTVEMAKKLFTKEAKDRLQQVVDRNKPTINFSNKLNNDMLMQALCRAVSQNTINISNLDEKTIKLLNSSTNTISYPKLLNILDVIHMTNDNIKCHIEIKDPNKGSSVIKEWFIHDKDDVTFIQIFDFVISYFEITPYMVRELMTKTLKPTVVNNVAQFVAKYQAASKEERESFVVSIRTITRLVNMKGYLIFAEFVNDKK
jgi:hypothetical protein